MYVNVMLMIMGINKYIITHFGKLLSFQRGGKSAPDCVVLSQLLLMPLKSFKNTVHHIL